jgi:hypothetical protein
LGGNAWTDRYWNRKISPSLHESNKHVIMSEGVESKIKVIDNPWTFHIAALFIGVFALPLLWRNPHFSRQSKWFISMTIVTVTTLVLFFGSQLLDHPMLKELGIF